MAWSAVPAEVEQGKGESTAADASIMAAAENAIILPEPIGDPFEQVNRGLWAFNQSLLKGVIQPSGKVYRAVVPGDFRRGFRNAGRNLSYPRNVLNNMFQGKWKNARNESYRFLLNSVGGVGGLFDVATPWIPAAPADFGQTLQDWGWDPRFYLMLPILGPSNERDAVGYFIDGVMNPISYFPPYSYIPHFITYNNLTDTVDDYIRVAKTNFDPYNVLRYAWTLQREAPPIDLAFEGEYDVPSLETLRTVFFLMRDPRFAERGEKRTAPIPGTGHELPFVLWLQPEAAPLIFITPGIGSHRLNNGALALSELLFNEGFSVVSVSSVFNYEFMERAATTALPGYTPADTRDLHVALTEIDRNISAKYPSRTTARALVGYSMGGFHSLYLAATEQTNDSKLVKFDRFLGIDTPVRLDRAIATLDDHFRAALDWPAAERTDRIESTMVKVVALARKLSTLTPDSPIPLNATESRFLVGLAFRLTLRDIIFVSQSKTNLGILKQELDKWNRDPVYDEIFQYSFGNYLEKFVVPYYSARGINLNDPEQLQAVLSLRAMEAGLKDNPKVRLVLNANDPLLHQEDVDWLEATFKSDRMTLFQRGGHLGNLGETVVQREILRAVADLLPQRPSY